MSLVCLQNQPEKWIIQNHDVRYGGIQSLCIYMESGMLSHLLYSSLGLQLGYKVICFYRNVSTYVHDSNKLQEMC